MDIWSWHSFVPVIYFRSFDIFEAIIWKAQPHALLLVKDCVLLEAEIFFHPFGLA